MKKIIISILAVLLVSCSNDKQQFQEALELKTHRVIEVIDCKRAENLETDSTYTIIGRYRIGDYIDADAVTFYK